MPLSYRFGRFELKVDQRRLLSDGEPVILGSRAFDLLHCLVEHQSRVVSKEELFAAVWPGMVVEDSNLTVQVSALRKVLGPDALATVQGQGYKFTLPRSDVPGPAAAQASTAVGAAAQPREMPTVAVLPLDVIGEEPKLRLLADGLTEDLIALLARMPGFVVICRASSFRFRRTSLPLAAVADQLGVRYLVEGSLRGNDPVKISARLSDAATGRVLWSGSFEAPAHAAPDLQEEIARSIITELEPQLDRAELAAIRRRRPENLDAWDHYRRGVAAIAQGGWGEVELAEARSELRLAFEVDPDFALARSHHALFTALGCNLGLIDGSPELVAETVADAERAAALDSGNPEVLGYVGCTLNDLGQPERGMQLLERALELDPSNAQAHTAYGASQGLHGEFVLGLERLRHAMRLSPKDRRLGFWSWVAGLLLMRNGRLDDSLAEARRASQRDPQLYLSRVLEAAVLEQCGRRQEALAALALARRLRPQLTLPEIAISHGKRAAAAIHPLWI
jgi:TolB-like protein